MIICSSLQAANTPAKTPSKTPSKLAKSTPNVNKTATPKVPPSPAPVDESEAISPLKV